jgi:hypothetical protein
MVVNREGSIYSGVPRKKGIGMVGIIRDNLNLLEGAVSSLSEGFNQRALSNVEVARRNISAGIFKVNDSDLRKFYDLCSKALDSFETYLAEGLNVSPLEDGRDFPTDGVLENLRRSVDLTPFLIRGTRDTYLKRAENYDSSPEGGERFRNHAE